MIYDRAHLIRIIFIILFPLARDSATGNAHSIPFGSHPPQLTHNCRRGCSSSLLLLTPPYSSSIQSNPIPGQLFISHAIAAAVSAAILNDIEMCGWHAGNFAADKYDSLGEEASEMRAAPTRKP